MSVSATARPPAVVLGYAELLAGQLAEACGSALRAVYLHGSAALGGWIPGRSDVDILFVAADGIGTPVLEVMASVILRTAQRCPGRELESSAVTVTQAARPGPPWPFLLHAVAGPAPAGRKVVPGRDSPGDADLLMHYAVCRARGWPVYGPPPRDLIGAVPRHWILGYLAGEVAWGLEHAPEAYAVLNACRAMIYLTDGEIVSKIAGGEAALQRGSGPAGVIRRALSQQTGREPNQPPGPDAADFALTVAAALRSAAGTATP
jgi:streptomycin 3"-adenylyltransferase